MEVKFCRTRVEFPGDKLGELRDSSGLLDDMNSLKDRMKQDGYLLLRNFIERKTVLNARASIVDFLDEKSALVKGEPPFEAVMPRTDREVRMTGQTAVTHNHSCLALFENEKLFDFFLKFFGQEAITYDYKWLRAVGNENFTGCHYDVVYMGRGSANVHTVWIPVGEIPVSQGTLAICEGSHNLDSFKLLRRTTNLTDRFRISCDIRFQPAGEPLDERWAGKDPKGHYAWGKDERPERPIAEMRKEWGI